MKKQIKIAAAILAYAAVATTAHASTFTNGGFETGDLSGWTQQGGLWYGGSNYNLGYASPNNVITNPGADPIVGAALNQVYNGQHSARINDWVNNNSVSTVKQSVKNYTDGNIFFEWAAVLQASHGPYDSDHFRLTLTDDTTHQILVDRQYNSYNNGPIFHSIGSGWSQWFYTNWQVEQVDLKSLGAVGHDFTLELLASDCPYGGHAGYVYLDGFAPTIIQPGPTQTPEPSSFALIGLGLAGLGLARRRMKK